MKKIFRKATSRVWNEEKVNFLKENYKKLSYQEIANFLNLSYDAISHKAFRLRLDSRELWTTEENNIIKENYSCNPDVWSLLPNRSRGSVIVQARKLGYQRQCGNYKINYKFFEEWNPESAYVIGFFAADGCVEPHLNRISCELSMKDYDHLLNIKNLMNCKNPICIKKTRYACSLYIHNTKMVKDIVSKGIIPNKTTRQKLPNVPKEFLRDFIRGYFDGDGSIYMSDSGFRPTYLFLGNLGFISDVEKVLEDVGCSKKIPAIHNAGSTNCYRIKYSAKDDVGKIYSFMYYPNCFNLARKLALASGVTPGKINSAQISQVISLSNEEPERKTDLGQISAQRLNAEPLMLKLKGDGIVQ